MPRDVHLNDVDPVLSELDYPASRELVAAELGDVVLVYADGREELTAVLDRIHEDDFSDADDLRGSLFASLPTEAVGEPGQSEGEG